MEIKLCSGGCGKNLNETEARPDLVDKCYSCSINGKDLTPKKYLTNLNFVPKQKRDSEISTVAQGQ